MFFMIRNAFEATAVKYLMCVCTCVRAFMSFRVCVHACIQQLLRACLGMYVISVIVAYVDVYVRVDAYEGVCVCVCVRVCVCVCV